MEIPSNLAFGVRVAAPQVRVFSGESPEVAAAPAEAVGQLAEVITKVGAQFEERAADLERARKFTELSTELTRSRTDLDLKMANHRDHETYMETWESGWKDIQENVLKAARVDPYVYKATAAEAARSYAHEYSTQKSRQRQYQVENTEAAYERKVQALEASVKTPVDYESARIEALNLNNAFFNLFGATKHLKNMAEVPKRLAMSLISKTIEGGDYETPIAWLNNEGNPIFHAFADPTDRQKVLKHVEAQQQEVWNRAWTNQQRLEHDEQNMMKNAADQIITDFDVNGVDIGFVKSLVAEGFYDGWLDDAHQRFLVDKYQALSDHKEQQGRTVGHSPMYGQLVGQFWGLKGRYDIEAAGTTAYKNGHINATEWSELMKLGAMDSQFNSAPDWKNAKEGVLHGLDPKYSSLLGSSLQSTEDQININNAMTELYDIWRKEPNVDASAARDKVLQKYKGRMKTYTPAPQTVTDPKTNTIYNLTKPKDAAALFAKTPEALTPDQWKAVWRGLGVAADNTGNPITEKK